MDFKCLPEGVYYQGSAVEQSRECVTGLSPGTKLKAEATDAVARD